jgi:hypothetical protein
MVTTIYVVTNQLIGGLMERVKCDIVYKYTKNITKVHETE